jgi:hypothetical protein
MNEEDPAVNGQGTIAAAGCHATSSLTVAVGEVELFQVQRARPRKISVVFIVLLEKGLQAT